MLGIARRTIELGPTFLDPQRCSALDLLVQLVAATLRRVDGRAVPLQLRHRRSDLGLERSERGSGVPASCDRLVVAAELLEGDAMLGLGALHLRRGPLHLLVAALGAPPPRPRSDARRPRARRGASASRSTSVVSRSSASRWRSCAATSSRAAWTRARSSVRSPFGLPVAVQYRSRSATIRSHNVSSVAPASPPAAASSARLSEWQSVRSPWESSAPWSTRSAPRKASSTVSARMAPTRSCASRPVSCSARGSTHRRSVSFPLCQRLRYTKRYGTARDLGADLGADVAVDGLGGTHRVRRGVVRGSRAAGRRPP